MFEGKTAVVTGASGGIGRAIAIALAKEGAQVAVHYRGNRAKAEAVREEITAAGGTAEIFACDVADFESCKQFIKQVTDRFGKIDILVNNAGITKDGLLMGMKENDFSDVIDTNLKGTFNCMKFVVRQMMKQKYGRIINISSVSGVAGNAGQANYCASKAGVIGLTKSAAKETASTRAAPLSTRATTTEAKTSPVPGRVFPETGRVTSSVFCFVTTILEIHPFCSMPVITALLGPIRISFSASSSRKACVGAVCGYGVEVNIQASVTLGVIMSAFAASDDILRQSESV